MPVWPVHRAGCRPVSVQSNGSRRRWGSPPPTPSPRLHALFTCGRDAPPRTHWDPSPLLGSLGTDSLLFRGSSSHEYQLGVGRSALWCQSGRGPPDGERAGSHTRKAPGLFAALGTRGECECLSGAPSSEREAQTGVGLAPPLDWPQFGGIVDSCG